MWDQSIWMPFIKRVDVLDLPLDSFSLIAPESIQDEIWAKYDETPCEADGHLWCTLLPIDGEIDRHRLICYTCGQVTERKLPKDA